jgi:hypothetical protein
MGAAMAGNEDAEWAVWVRRPECDLYLHGHFRIGLHSTKDFDELQIREHLATLSAPACHGRRVDCLLGIQANAFHANFAPNAEIKLI